MRRIVPLAVVCGLSVSVSACGSIAPPRELAAGRARVSIGAASLAQKSVHWTGWTVRGPNETSDVAIHSGEQRFDLDGGKVEFRLVNNVVYFRGNHLGLSPLYQLLPWELTKAQIRQYARKWIAIPKGDKWYADAADRLTLASLIHDEIPDATPSNWRLENVTKWSHGTKLRVLEAVDKNVPGVVYESLSGHAAGDRLLVGTSDFFGPGDGGGGRFSKWNEPVDVQAPAHAIPIATVRRR